VATPAVEVTLGFYESAWWSRQIPTPGVVDARSHGVVLWGDATLPARLPGPAPGRLSPWEALRLVGNRALELLAAPGPHSVPALRPRGWYALAKAMSSLWTARLLLAGRYQVGWGARRVLLEQEGCGADARAADAVLRGALAWAPFLERPGERTLPPVSAWLPAYRDALETWLASLPADLRGPAEPIECAFLAQPVSLRERWRVWRAEGSRARACVRIPGGPRGRLLTARRALAPGTPEGRRMAAAVLYWCHLPDRPEPSWGESPSSDLDAGVWEARIDRLLGWHVPAGPGCRSRLMEVLGLEVAPITGVEGGERG
jgi:hypothetical protein